MFYSYFIIYRYFIRELLFIAPIAPIILMGAGWVMYRIVDAVLKRSSREMGPRGKTALHLTIIVLTGIPLGLYLQGSFTNKVGAILGIFYFLLPCLVVLTVVAAVFYRRAAATCGRLALVILACGLALLLSLPVGGLVDRWKVNAARAYAVQAIPFLDQIKEKAGEYPMELPVSALGQPPSLLGYRSDGTNFRFDYGDPAAFMSDGYELTSTNRTWNPVDD